MKGKGSKIFGTVLLWGCILVAFYVMINGTLEAQNPAETPPAATTAEVKKKQNIMEKLNVKADSLMFWTVITFGVLLAILSKYGWGPIINALDGRMEKIKADIDHAEKSRLESEEILVQQKELLGRARSEAQGIIEKARADGVQMKDEIVSKARQEANAATEKARREVEGAKEKAIEELKNEVGQISLDIASKVINKTLKPADHQELIAKALSEYQNQN